jgi:hypothetical protein
MSRAGVYAKDSRLMGYIAKVTAQLDVLAIPAGLPDEDYERIEEAFAGLLRALGRRIDETWCPECEGDVLADMSALLFAHGRAK